MGIGKRKQIKLTPYTNAANAVGSAVETPGTGVSLWAEITSPSGGRGYEISQTKLSNTRQFMVRYQFDKYPNADWRLKYDGKEWTVTEIQKMDEKKFYYLITATTKDY